MMNGIPNRRWACLACWLSCYIAAGPGCHPTTPPEKSKPEFQATFEQARGKSEPEAAVGEQSAGSPENTSSFSSEPTKPWFANLESARTIDLTHPLDANTIYWPTEEDFRLETEFAGINDQGFYYASNRFTAAEHGGTHVDAPIHFAEGAETVDEVPLSRLSGPAAVIDVSEACQENRNYLVSIDDLRRWEQRHGQSLDGHIVLLRTGFSKYWPDREKYLGTSLRGKEGVAALQFPGLDPQAASWLAETRAIRSIGIDTASIDHGPSQDFLSHRTLFKHNIPALENVAHLEKLPSQGAWIIALPIKIGGGSGGPTRILALLPAEEAEQ